MIDTIGLSNRLANYENKEVKRFLRQDKGHLPQPVSVFGISNLGFWTLGRSSMDGNALADELDRDKTQFLAKLALHSRMSEGETGLFTEDPPGLTALKALGQIAAAARQQPGRKLLLWVGPGWGTGSGARFFTRMDQEQIFDTIDWFSTLMREARLVLFSFSVGQADLKLDGMNAPITPSALLFRNSLGGVKTIREATIEKLDRKVLAVESGGRVLEPGDDLATTNMYTGLTDRTPAFDLVSQMKSCTQEAGQFYELSFNPASTELASDFHELQVRIDKPGLSSRTSTGYYDQPYFHDQPQPEVRPVTIEKLRQQLAAAKGKRDAELAKQIAEEELTEPASDAEISSLQAGLRGPKANAALVALADASRFLEPSAAANPEANAPDPAAQQRMILLAEEYLKTSLPRLPNLFATRTTVRYREIPEHYDDSGASKIAYEPLHWVDTSTSTVIYHNGNEIADPVQAKGKRKSERGTGLTDRGSFGPILETAAEAIASGALTWSRWETDANGTRAVFRYPVAGHGSRFQIEYCCLPDGDGTRAFKALAGHHGEIAIDPSSGAILRILVQSDLSQDLPMIRADTMVEYGPVEIGGKTYICPVKSISITRYRTVSILSGLPGAFRTFGPFATSLNDVSFGDYHVFRSQTRILPDFSPTTPN
jgi:hypothetical protein